MAMGVWWEGVVHVPALMIGGVRLREVSRGRGGATANPVWWACGDISEPFHGTRWERRKVVLQEQQVVRLTPSKFCLCGSN